MPKLANTKVTNTQMNELTYKHKSYETQLMYRSYQTKLVYINYFRQLVYISYTLYIILSFFCDDI
jgi:hypothetical protein